MAGVETALVKAAIEWLGYNGYHVWRQNTGAVKATYKGKTRFIRYGTPGISDIVGMTPTGRFIACEAKIGRNEPTAAQTAFLALVNDGGGIGVVFYSIDDLAAKLSEVTP